MNRCLSRRGGWPAVVFLYLLSGAAIAADAVVDRLSRGEVLLLRHATAPGFGDPAGFQADDCSTQRNLSDAGRRQAKAIGAWLRARGISQARVYSSQWCRCLETATLLELGEVSALPALNSFFQRSADRGPNLAALRSFLAQQPAPTTPLILVTHQVTVTAVTGITPGSGEGVVASLAQDGKLSDFVRLTFDE